MDCDFAKMLINAKNGNRNHHRVLTEPKNMTRLIVSPHTINTNWHLVSDESFINMEKYCEISLNSSSESPSNQRKNLNSTTQHTKLPPIKQLLDSSGEISSSSDDTLSSSTPNTSFTEHPSLVAAINQLTLNECEISDVDKFNMSALILHASHFNDTIDAVDFFIEQGRRLVEQENGDARKEEHLSNPIALTLSSNRTKMLRDLASIY